jgi:hypothetical protein
MNRISQSAWLLLAVTVACAGNSTPGREHRDFSVLTHDEMESSHFQYAYDAVASMRSNWLNTHGTDSFVNPSRVLVYLDNTRLGGIETLRAISIAQVAFIKHYDSLEATQRWRRSGVSYFAGTLSTA